MGKVRARVALNGVGVVVAVLFAVAFAFVGVGCSATTPGGRVVQDAAKGDADR